MDTPGCSFPIEDRQNTGTARKYKASVRPWDIRSADESSRLQRPSKDRDHSSSSSRWGVTRSKKGILPLPFMTLPSVLARSSGAALLDSRPRWHCLAHRELLHYLRRPEHFLR